MNFETTPTSIAGAWGDSRQKKKKSAEELRRCTTFRDSFHDMHLKDHVERNQNSTYSKFRSSQDKCFMLLPYGVTNPHILKLPVEEERFDPDFYETSSGLSQGRDKLSSMQRTQLKLRTSDSAPIAAGRSGLRQERGVSTSGLLGEKLCLSPSPSFNTLVQRSWMPTEDPALCYKIRGVPVATLQKSESSGLDIGNTDKVEVGWVHQRRAALTGNAFGKGVGIFFDEISK